MKIVPQLGCVSQDSDALVSQRGKQSQGNPMQKVLGSIRKVRFTQSTPRQASIRENQGPSLGKIQVKLPHQRSPYAVKFEDRSHEETERQQRCARSKAWNLAKNIYKLKEKDKTTFYSPAGEWVLPAASTKEPEEREFVVDSGAGMHMVSKKTLTLPSWRPWGHRGVLRRWWRPTARCKQEKKPRYMSKNWTYSWRLCFLKKLPQFFLSGSSARIMGIPTTGPAVKNHISQKRARELIAILSNYVPFVVPGLSTSSSTTPTPTLSSPSSQDSVFDVEQIHRKSSTQKEVEARVRSYGETRCMKPTETENTK